MVRRLKVQVWLYWVPQSMFLLLKTQPERGGFWQPVTGGVDAGEGLEEAALREVQEETGLSPLSGAGSLFRIGEPFEFESQWGPATETPFALEVTQPLDRPPVVRLDAREHDQFAWVSAQEALSRVKFASNSKVLRALLDKLGS